MTSGVRRARRGRLRRRQVVDEIGKAIVTEIVANRPNPATAWEYLGASSRCLGSSPVGWCTNRGFVTLRCGDSMR